MKQTEERLTLTINEAAKALGVGRHTLYEAVRAGKVPTIRMGRRVVIPKYALLTFMGVPQSHATPALPNDEGTARSVAPRALSYEEGVADERARVTDLLVRFLAEVRSP
jgi:excisionase family DNA binding protein